MALLTPTNLLDTTCKKVVADSDGSKFIDSKNHSSFVGRHTTAQVFQKGEMQACHEFCPCSPCLLGQYTRCELKPEMGTMHNVIVPWLSGPPLRQLEELAAWSELLKVGMLVALAVDSSETHIEGSYWLALVTGPAFVVPDEQVLHASDRFEAGWLVVKAKWFELVTVSPRCYRLQTEDRHLVVSEMIWLAGLNPTPYPGAYLNAHLRRRRQSSLKYGQGLQGEAPKFYII